MVIETVSRCMMGRLQLDESAPPLCRGWTWRLCRPGNVHGRTDQELETLGSGSPPELTEVRPGLWRTWSVEDLVMNLHTGRCPHLMCPCCPRRSAPPEGGRRLWPPCERRSRRLGSRRRSWTGPQERRTSTQRSTEGGRPGPVVLRKNSFVKVVSSGRLPAGPSPDLRPGPRS